MSIAPASPSTHRKPLRLWPGVAAAILLILVRLGLPIVRSDSMFYANLGGLVCVLLILLWWLLFSRAPWLERLGAVVLVIAAIAATKPLVDVSIRTGMMGMIHPIYSIFMLAPVLVVWAVAARHLTGAARYTSMVAAILLTCGAFTLIRTGGIKGSGGLELAWRWSKTPEEKLLARAGGETPMPKTAAAAASGAAEWPGFRGPNRDAVAPGLRIKTDWAASPPVSLWRRPIGPGWSSFAVDGDRIYTQEQRGDDELVSCYDKSTGEPVWQHRDAVRFWESNAGAGPRGTPALDSGRLYALGATGILNALDAGSGDVVWSRNVGTDAGKKVPMWGFSSSPLVMGDVVIVAASGQMMAYDIAAGAPRWKGPALPGSYSSPHRMTLDGVEQVVMMTIAGATSVAPADGAVLWKHDWEAGMSVMQPALLPEGDLLISTSGGAGGMGIRRLAVTHGSGGWTTAERWTSAGLKPYFNDFVAHKGSAYGFDGSILSCIDLAGGERRWKGGRYGDGQLVLLPDSNALLVLSEDGELALVAAAPDAYRELARVPAIEGKTWNHLALAGDVLLVRNGEEMAALRLPLADR